MSEVSRRANWGRKGLLGSLIDSGFAKTDIQVELNVFTLEEKKIK